MINSPRLRLLAVLLFVAMILLALFNLHRQPTAKHEVLPISFPPDGQGLYELCAPDKGSMCFDRLKQIAGGGFRLVINYDQLFGSATQEMAYADQAQRFGMKVIWNLAYPAFSNGANLIETFPELAASCDCSDNPGFIRYVIKVVKNHPATWGYYIGEEVPPRDHAVLRAFSDVVHQLDPTHPRLFVAEGDGLAVNRSLALFTDTAEVVAQDYYPIGDPRETLAGTATVAHGVQAIADKFGKQSAMILQAHSLGQYSVYADLCDPFPACMPYPTRDQMRQLRDLTLQHAHPRLILWYSYFDVLRSDNSALRWSNLVAAAGAKEDNLYFFSSMKEAVARVVKEAVAYGGKVERAGWHGIRKD